MDHTSWIHPLFFSFSFTQISSLWSILCGSFFFWKKRSRRIFFGGSLLFLFSPLRFESCFYFYIFLFLAVPIFFRLWGFSKLSKNGWRYPASCGGKRQWVIPEHDTNLLRETQKLNRHQHKLTWNWRRVDMFWWILIQAAIYHRVGWNLLFCFGRDVNRCNI